MEYIQYDSRIIREFATRLYRYADSLITLFGFLGAAAGAVFGCILGKTMDIAAYGAVSGILLGAIVGAMVGRSLGFKYRLQAQVALCQVQIEENTRGGVVRVETEQRPANVNAA